MESVKMSVNFANFFPAEREGKPHAKDGFAPKKSLYKRRGFPTFSRDVINQGCSNWISLFFCLQLSLVRSEVQREVSCFYIVVK